VESPTVVKNTHRNAARNSFLVFGSPSIEEDEIQEVVDSLRSGWLGAGFKVARFVADFGRHKGAPHTAAVNSCTAARHLSMLAAGLGPGDEAITTALTFYATANAIIHADLFEPESEVLTYRHADECVERAARFSCLQGTR